MNRTAAGLLLLAIFVAYAPVHAAPLIVTATFQNGDSNSYSGTFDRRLLAPSTGGNGSAVDNYALDGGASALNDTGARHGLLRFDNFVSALPAGAKVVSASVDMMTSGGANAQSGGAYNLYRSNTAFDSTSTWGAAPFGADGIVGNVSDILGSFEDLTINTPASARADKTVQAWIDGESNLGFGIRSDRSTDGWEPHTTGAAIVANRPKLTVNYTLDPLVDIDAYQQGVNSYSGTVDLRIDSGAGGTPGVDQDGSTVQETFIDGFEANADPTMPPVSADQAYLLRFNGLNLSGLAEIFKAELVIKSGFSSANADSPGPFTVHQMLRDWNTSSTYASFDSDSNPAVNGPQELQAAGTIGPSATSVTGINDTEVMYIDVTSIVENWRAGQSNFGFYIGTNGPASGGTGNGWQIFTSGATDTGFRPELRIIGVAIPEPVSAMMMLMGGVLVGLGAARRTTR